MVQRRRGDSGWFSEKWGGGWYTSDGTWIRAYNGKNVWTPGVVQADGAVSTNYVSSWGRVRAGEFVQIDGVANEGWGCGPNGLVGRTWNGKGLNCVDGIWQSAAGGIKNYADFDWFPGYGTFGTGLPYSNWNCAPARRRQVCWRRGNGSGRARWG
ncbi:shufflon system plasmid conjugative transfer pilus tip adhesin PilV [Cupriavidus basilensis]